MISAHRESETIAFLESLEKQDAAPSAYSNTGTYPTTGSPAYTGAKVDRLTKAFQPHHRSGDQSLLESWGMLTGRLRDLIRNEPSLGNAKRALCKHIIRTGILTYADAMNDNEEELEKYNSESDRWFDHWACEEADAEGRRSWHEMQFDGHSECVEVGDMILLKCLKTKPGRSVPLCYQQIEAEQVDCSKDRPAAPGQNRIVRGVELNSSNEMVGMYVYDAHPYDQYSGWTSASTFIPADRIVHYYVPFRPSMTRGISWFHALVRSTRDIDWFFGNELKSSALRALLTTIHKTKTPSRGLGLSGGDLANEIDALGNAILNWSPGSSVQIGTEDEIKVLESGRTGQNAGDWIKLGRQEQSMGTGISYVTMTGDFSQTSFTSAHGAANEDDAYFQPLQQRFGMRVCLPVRKEHTRMAVAAGRIKTVSARDFQRDPQRYLQFTLLPPGRAQLDPTKQTQAGTDRIRAGRSTLADECGSEGKYWKKVIRQRSREIKYCESLGVEPDFSAGGSPPADDSNDATDKKDAAERAMTGQQFSTARW